MGAMVRRIWRILSASAEVRWWRGMVFESRLSARWDWGLFALLMPFVLLMRRMCMSMFTSLPLLVWCGVFGSEDDVFAAEVWQLW